MKRVRFAHEIEIFDLSESKDDGHYDHVPGDSHYTTDDEPPQIFDGEGNISSDDDSSLSEMSEMGIRRLFDSVQNNGRN